MYIVYICTIRTLCTILTIRPSIDNVSRYEVRLLHPTHYRYKYTLQVQIHITGTKHVTGTNTAYRYKYTLQVQINGVYVYLGYTL